MIPKSRVDLETRILQDLGEPVIKVNLAKEQLDNAIDDAIEYWQQWHHESQDRTFLSIKVTKEMLESNAVPLPENVFAVLSILKGGGSGSGKVSWLSYEFEMTKDMVFDSMKPGSSGSSGGGMSAYILAKNNLSNMQHILNAPMPFDYRYHKRELSVLDDLSKYYNEGDFMVIEVMGYLYKDSHNIWGDESLRKLATAYAKRYWGQNLIKFAGVSLPGGVTLNGTEIYQQAMQDIEKQEAYILELSEPYGIILS